MSNQLWIAYLRLFTRGAGWAIAEAVLLTLMVVVLVAAVATSASIFVHAVKDVNELVAAMLGVTR